MMEVGGKEVVISSDTIRRDTEGVLGNLLVLTESLPVLPGSSVVSMKLAYHDAVTPEDYQPAGFEASTPVEPRVVGSRRVEVGTVTTRHQALALSAVTATGGSEVETRQEELGSPAAELPVSCVCGSSTMDPMMVRCQHCGGLEHAACYRILEREQLPEHHCCFRCSQEVEGSTCTDAKLARMIAKKPEVMASTFLFRRLLVALATEELATVAAVVRRLGAGQEEIAPQLARLAEEGVVVLAGDEESFQVSATILVVANLWLY